jgi:hypothetical protein
MLVLNVQFWPGDRDQAMQLARLIADLEPNYRDDVVFLFTARFDTAPDPETVEYVGQKFPVRLFTTTVRSTGWPVGCNQMMAESYQHCIQLARSGKIKASAVMFIEADAVPLCAGWLDKLIEEYRGCGKQILGPWITSPCEHVNGNCIISLEFWKKHRAIFAPPAWGGWDVTCGPAILRNAAPSRLMWSDYHLGTAKNEWRGCEYLFSAKRHEDPKNPLYGVDLQPAWFHGPKDMRGIECVRNRLLA